MTAKQFEAMARKFGSDAEKVHEMVEKGITMREYENALIDWINKGKDDFVERVAGDILDAWELHNMMYA